MSLKNVNRIRHFFLKKAENDVSFAAYVSFSTLGDFLNEDGIRYYDRFGFEKYKKLARSFYNNYKNNLNNNK